MASRDRSQGIAFVYDNVLELYKKAKAGNLSEPVKIIKSSKVPAIYIKAFKPKEFIIPAKILDPSLNASSAGPSFRDLKSNIENLRNLHSRLRFMLSELEEIVDE